MKKLKILIIIYLLLLFVMPGYGQIFYIDYKKEVIRVTGDDHAIVECSPTASPFTVKPLAELIGNTPKTIYCRLSKGPGSIKPLEIPGRPSVSDVTVDYSNILLMGNTENIAWRDTLPDHKIIHYKVTENGRDITDSIRRIVAGYPGLVAERERRLPEVEVVIDARYERLHPDARHSMVGYPNPWFETGLYAPPLEVIVIKKPASLNGKKIICRIGSSSSSLKEEKKDQWERLKTLYVEKVLKDNDTTHIVNYSGGLIYIVPESSLPEPETFIISGAVKAPNFVLGKTDPQEWIEEIRHTGVPMAELISDRLIWTMTTNRTLSGRTFLSAVTEPVALMEYYREAIIEDFNVFHGLSDTATNPLHRPASYATRAVDDIQTHVGAAYAGYPNMFGNGHVYAQRGARLNKREGDPDPSRGYQYMLDNSSGWGFFHEVGHNYQMPTWMWSEGSKGAIGEVSNNLHFIHHQNRLHGRWHANQINKYGPVVERFKKRHADGLECDYSADYIDYDEKLVMFCQLAQKYGWRILAWVSTRARELPNRYAEVIRGANPHARREFFCKTVCEYAGADLRPFFDFWGVKYGKQASADMATLPAYEGEKFWEVWNPAIVPNPNMDVMKRPQKLLPHNNYNLIEGEIVRDEWVIVESECRYWKNTGEPYNTPYNMLDGAGGTYWASQDVSRPIYNNKPVLVIDMRKENEFNYIRYKHRDFGYMRVNCKRFKLEAKLTENGNWAEVGTFINGEDVKVYNHFELQTTVKARYLRLTLLEGVSDGNTTGSACVAEFLIGKEDK